MRVPVIRNITVRTAANTTAWTLDKTQTNAHEAFFYIECVCNAWFTLEILSRFVASPNKCEFIKASVNIIDYIATLSFYIDLVRKLQRSLPPKTEVLRRNVCGKVTATKITISRTPLFCPARNAISKRRRLLESRSNRSDFVPRISTVYRIDVESIIDF